MYSRNWPLLLVVAAVASLIPARTTCAEASPPNIVFILADDLGWSDTTLFGTTKLYETPNIEKLARRGVTFSRAYSASPLCSPTRASILTGQNPARVGITSPSCHLPRVLMEPAVAKSAPPTSKSLQCQSATRLKTDYYTLAEALKDAGYATGHYGKWHLGPEPFDPLHHGYDVDIPHWPGPGPAGSYVAPWRFPKFKERTAGEHIEDRIGDEAVVFLERHKDQPFFLSYWQFSVHAPFDAKSQLVEKYRKRVDKNDLQRSPTYAAMVQSLDDNVGKVLDALDRLELTDRTIIIFFSDNGGNMYNEIDDTTPTSNAPLRGGKATMYEGGVRVPCIVAWPGVTQPETRSNALIQSCDFYPTIVDLLDLPRTKLPHFDGRSVRQALEGKPFDRGPIFTFFPHLTKVPDHLPPAVSVHLGDWKLIRIFYDGVNQQHRYELYNLAEDIGETRDLANTYPDRVQQLDALITEFLQDTNAVVPKKNPLYNPQSAELSRAGVIPMRECHMTVVEGHLLVKSTGADPHFQLRLTESIPKQELTFVLRMKSDARGTAQLFWQEEKVTPAYFRERSILFKPKPAPGVHEYEIQFTPNRPVTSLRLDPSQGPGTIEIEAARLLAQDGRVLKEWVPIRKE